MLEVIALLQGYLKGGVWAVQQRMRWVGFLFPQLSVLTSESKSDKDAFQWTYKELMSCLPKQLSIKIIMCLVF